MSDNFHPQWSQGNDGFGYHERACFVETPNPVTEAEAQFLVNIVINFRLPKLERENAYLKLIKQYGHHIEPNDAEWFCNHDTDSEESGSDASDSDASGSCSDGSCSDGSDSDGSCSDGSCSDGSGSEQCPVASQNSQSMGQQLLPNNSDAKVAVE